MGKKKKMLETTALDRGRNELTTLLTEIIHRDIDIGT